MEEPILHVNDWINDRIVITVARSYSCIISGACLPSPLWDRNQVWETDWDMGSGLDLAQ